MLNEHSPQLARTLGASEVNLATKVPGNSSRRVGTTLQPWRSPETRSPNADPSTQAPKRKVGASSASTLCHPFADIRCFGRVQGQLSLNWLRLLRLLWGASSLITPRT